MRFWLEHLVRKRAELACLKTVSTGSSLPLSYLDRGDIAVLQEKLRCHTKST